MGSIASGGTRKGDPPDGWMQRGTEVTIYLTVKGRFVVHVLRWQEHGDVQHDEVRVADAGEELLAALLESSGRSLGSASRDAWNEACEKHEPLRPLAVERLD